MTPARLGCLSLLLLLTPTFIGSCSKENKVENNQQLQEPTETIESSSDTLELPKLVRFLTEDGKEISGYEFGSGEIGIVLAHMRGRGQSSWFEFARHASELGYKVLTFDFRGYGNSTGKQDTRMDRDLKAAIAYIRKEEEGVKTGVEKVVIIGASMGGAAGIYVADQENVDGVAVLSPPTTYGRINALEAAVSMNTALLIVVAENDPPYNKYANQFRSTAPTTQFIEIAGSQHGTNLFAEQPEQLYEQLLAFVYARTR